MDKKNMKVPKERPTPHILKVKDIDPDTRFNDIHPNLPQMPCLALLIGSVRSGKSNLLCNFFMNDSMYKGLFDTVTFISTTLHTDNKGVLLSKYFDCYDHYDDQIIHGIMKEQSQYDRADRPSYALVVDDCLTQDFSKSNAVSFFSTRFRHYIDFYCISTQSFRAVSGMIRNNANVIFICRQQNKLELDKIAEEYSPMVGGYDNFMKWYKIIHKEKYQIMVIDNQSNPSRILHNFEKVVYEGNDEEHLDD